MEGRISSWKEHNEADAGTVQIAYFVIKSSRVRMIPGLFSDFRQLEGLYSFESYLRMIDFEGYARKWSWYIAVISNR